MSRRATNVSHIEAFRGQGGSARAREFERLYRENYALVYNYISYYMADPSAAEDVTSEAFLKAARAFSRFDPSRAKFSTWVITIARNCAADHARKARPTSNIDDVPDGAFAAEDDYPGLDDSAKLVQELLATLDPDVRELVFMKYYQGKRNVDIARELNMNESTVATSLQRALQKMRKAAEGSR